MTSELALTIRFAPTHLPMVLDLSGSFDFDTPLSVRRGASEKSRPFNFLVADSLFDTPRAFSSGHLKLIDLTSNEPVDLSHLGRLPDEEELESSHLVTLPAREGRLPRFGADILWPLHIGVHLKQVLVLRHRYRIELADLDLRVKWWAYGERETLKLDTPDVQLPPSEPAKLVATHFIHNEFLVVKSLPTPPEVLVTMSLSSSVLHRSESPPTMLSVSITNKSKSPITVRSTGDQYFINPDVNETTPNQPRITSARPSIDNFSIIDCSTGEDLIAPAKHTCSLSACPGHMSRTSLRTLEPNVPLVHSFPLMGKSRALKERMCEAAYSDFVLKLRPMGVWWMEGTIEENFGDKKLLKRASGGARLPLMLQSQDEIRFRLVD